MKEKETGREGGCTRIVCCTSARGQYTKKKIVWEMPSRETVCKREREGRGGGERETGTVRENVNFLSVLNTTGHKMS